MSPIDTNTLERKLANIVKELSLLSELSKNKLSAGSDIRDQYTLLHSLQNALSSAIDIAQHIVCEEGGMIPDSYADAISKLATIGYLDKEFAKRFSEAARFRNKLVHTYEEIDMTKVVADLPGMIGDLKEFVKCVGEKI